MSRSVVPSSPAPVATLEARRSALTAMVAEDPQRLRRRSIARGVSPSDADDIAQTALLRAWRSIEHLDASRPGQLCAWLDTIAKNAAIDLARQRRRRAEEELDAELPDGHDAHGETEMRIILDRALQAIRDLPETLREPLLLSAVEGLATHEIAVRLGVQPATVRQRISRARRILAGCRASGMSPEG